MLSLVCVSACVAESRDGAATMPPGAATTPPDAPAAPPKADAPAAPPERSAATSAASTPARTVMPDLRGVNAAMARDALARRGLSSVKFASAERDVRFVVQSADWHVVRQPVAAGAMISTIWLP